MKHRVLDCANVSDHVSHSNTQSNILAQGCSILGEINHLFMLLLSFILLCLCFFFELFKRNKNTPKTIGGYKEFLPFFFLNWVFDRAQNSFYFWERDIKVVFGF